MRADYAVWEGDPELPEFQEPSFAPPPRTLRRGPRRRRRRLPGCLPLLGLGAIAAVGGLLLLLLTSNMLVKPLVRDAAIDGIQDGVRREVQEQIATQLADEPSGEVTISEAELNDRIATSDLGPIDQVTVRITPEGLVVSLEAYHLSGEYQANVLEQDGSLVIDSGGGEMSGPLSYVVPAGELEAAVNSEVAAALSESGYTIESVALEDGVMTLRLVS